MLNLLNIAGFTGTQQGMNKRQRRKFREIIVALNPTEFHHGDCIGADADAHSLVRKYLPQCKIIIHPPRDSRKRAFCEGDIVLPTKEYLDRNKDIVIASTTMLATPYECEEQLRSGTWSTVRYARKLQRKLELILPLES